MSILLLLGGIIKSINMAFKLAVLPSSNQQQYEDDPDATVIEMNDLRLKSKPDVAADDSPYNHVEHLGYQPDTLMTKKPTDAERIEKSFHTGWLNYCYAVIDTPVESPGDLMLNCIYIKQSHRTVWLIKENHPIMKFLFDDHMFSPPATIEALKLFDITFYIVDSKWITPLIVHVYGKMVMNETITNPLKEYLNPTMAVIYQEVQETLSQTVTDPSIEEHSLSDQELERQYHTKIITYCLTERDTIGLYQFKQSSFLCNCIQITIDSETYWIILDDHPILDFIRSTNTFNTQPPDEHENSLRLNASFSLISDHWVTPAILHIHKRMYSPEHHVDPSDE